MKRVIRVLEYSGEEEFVNRSLRNRNVKGGHFVRGGAIREAFLGNSWDGSFEPLIAPMDEATHALLKELEELRKAREEISRLKLSDLIGQ
jgi:hypothetical protein